MQFHLGLVEIKRVTDCLGTRIRVSARVKNGEFSKYLILRRSDKAF